MNKLAVNYLGLPLRSPVIAGSSRLTSTLENLIQADRSGAGAVVLKSLFEEQIAFHINSLSGSDYPEADDYLSFYTRENSVDEYLSLIRNAKEKLSIPVIPSINCFSSDGWIDFASRIEEAGADAIEINIFFMPADPKKNSSESEKEYLDIIEKLQQRLRIPFAVKVSFRFTNLLHIADQFYKRGVNGIVMFNRFYEPDIDVNSMEIVTSPVFSTESERRNVLRWIAMTSALKLKMDISASTGVQSGEDVVRYILAGATTVQVCSALYKYGIGHIQTINNQISEWMSGKNFSELSEFRGKLNWKNHENPGLFERTQFMKHFASED